MSYADLHAARDSHSNDGCDARGPRDEGLDYVDSLLADDPELRALVDAARARMDRAYLTECHFKNCQVAIDPLTGDILYSAGPTGCGCDNLPGWRASRLASAPRPAVAALTRGRHGSRVARSHSRRR